MSNKNKPAYPVQTGFGVVSNGLTKRELIAAMAMQGDIQERGMMINDRARQESVTTAIKYADALLEALND